MMFRVLALLLCFLSSAAIAGSNTAQLSFQVKLENTCTIQATDLNFGNVGLSSRRYEATSTVTLKCTAGMPYQIFLMSDNSTDFSMTSANGDSIYFKTHSASFNGPAWGGGNHYVTGIATGNLETKTIYGVIPSGWTNKNPGYGNYVLPMQAVINF